MNSCAQHTRLCGFLAALFAMFALACRASASEPIVRVEEDWELVVNEPDPNCQAPQVTTIMSPRGDLAGHYFAFDLNHQSLPEYHGGGMQIQAWYFEEPSLSQNYPSSETLGYDGETVSWTQRMSFDSGVLSLDIVNGSSNTWGAFGGADLHLTTTTGAHNLNHYNPAVSVANSGVGFASNRVQWLKLKAVRYYSASGLVQEDSSPRTVYQHE